MMPGIITAGGLIGSDKRDLVQIIEEDAAAVKALGLTHGGIAIRMNEIRNAAGEGLGEYVKISDTLAARVSSVRGRLRCPFGDPGLVPKFNTTVKKLETGEELTFTDLNIHLIEKHGFYQGRGALFRLEPATLAYFIFH